jgi:hypothetical protein
MTSLPSNSSRRPLIPQSWLRLRYVIRDSWTGEHHQIDDKIYLTASRRGSAVSGGGSSAQPNGGCASSICRPAPADFDHDAPIGLLMLRSAKPSTTGHTAGTQALPEARQAHKLCRRLGDDPMDGHYPEKPPRMRGATYDRLLDKLIAANRVADERMLLASKLGAGRRAKITRRWNSL